MITVTVGTIQFPFDRMAHWLDQLLADKIIKEPVIFQHGMTDAGLIADHPLVTATPFLPYERLQDLISRSNLVISHAGQGSTRGLAAKKVPFVVVPRLACHGEHVDDHQLLFAQSVRPLGVQYCSTYDELKNSVVEPPPCFRGPLLQGPRLVEHFISTYNQDGFGGEAIASAQDTRQKKITMDQRFA